MLQRAQDTGELVIIGVDATKPFLELGVVSGMVDKIYMAEYARIGIMPRYGNADSIKWFQVESNSAFHLLNCFEEGMPKYGGLAKLYFEEPETNKINSQGGQSEELIMVEYHKSEQNTFCTEAALVPRQGSHEEDDGWIITFVHNEDTSMSKEVSQLPKSRCHAESHMDFMELSCQSCCKV
ncbi:hypothetical protein Peur_030494 [Populus x canadensis]